MSAGSAAPIPVPNLSVALRAPVRQAVQQDLERGIPILPLPSLHFHVDVPDSQPEPGLADLLAHLLHLVDD
jgi:hypothetical protein